MKSITLSQYHKTHTDPVDWAIFDLLSTTSDICSHENELSIDCVTQIEIAIKALSKVVSKVTIKNN